jgi:hypothetical protein
MANGVREMLENLQGDDEIEMPLGKLCRLDTARHHLSARVPELRKPGFGNLVRDHGPSLADGYADEGPASRTDLQQATAPNSSLGDSEPLLIAILGRRWRFAAVIVTITLGRIGLEARISGDETARPATMEGDVRTFAFDERKAPTEPTTCGVRQR